MLNRWQFLVLTSIAALALLLVIGNAVLFVQNRADQAALVQRQQFIQQSVQLESLQRNMLKSLAELATGSNDQQVLDLLGGLGYTVSNTTSTDKPNASR